jgi:hypothetical protein
MRAGALLVAATLCAQPPAQDPVFGTTVFSSAGLEGKVYFLSPGAQELPRFRESKAAGTIYTTKLDISPQSFSRGFPGIGDRFEWFAIDYRGTIWVDRPGVYRFRLLSDDGSKLWLNDRLVIDNDGLHGPEPLTASATLSRGLFRLRVAYFQGPRFELALVLSVRPPGRPWTIFNTDDYLVPAGEGRTAGTVSQIKRASNW